MIEFKIISTVDRGQISTYQHFGPELTFGKADGDMLIDDPQMGNLQLRVRITGSHATLENLDSTVEVRLNGKAVEGSSPMKEKDNVTVGKTSIQFMRLDLQPSLAPDPVNYRNAAGRFTPNSKEQAVLDGLEHLEKAAGGGSPAPKPPAPGGMPKPPTPGRMPPPLPKKN